MHARTHMHIHCAHIHTYTHTYPFLKVCLVLLQVLNFRFHVGHGTPSGVSLLRKASLNSLTGRSNWCKLSWVWQTMRKCENGWEPLKSGRVGWCKISHFLFGVQCTNYSKIGRRRTHVLTRLGALIFRLRSYHVLPPPPCTLQDCNGPKFIDSESFKGFYWPKARRKDVQKSSDISVYNTINREEVRRSRRWYIRLAFFLVCAWLVIVRVVWMCVNGVLVWTWVTDYSVSLCECVLCVFEQCEICNKWLLLTQDNFTKSCCL